MKTRGFTLTELLITLSIIGVVAILTVPNVTRNINTRVNIAKLQSTIDLLDNAMNTMKVRERVANMEDGSIVTNPSDFLSTYIKVISWCTPSEYSNCFNASYKSIDSSNTIGSSVLSEVSAVILIPSGAAISILPSTTTEGNERVMGGFFIDINGQNPPNVIGRDFFYVTHNASDGYIGAGGSDDADTLRSDCLTGSDNGRSCVQMLQNNNWESNY